MEFKNLKIEIFLKSSVAINPKKGAFDSVLALLYFNEMKNNKTFNGDYAQELPFLKKSKCGVYHTSFPILNDVQYYDKDIMIKKFDHDFYAKFGLLSKNTGKSVTVKDTTGGALKNSLFSIEKIGAKSITYYVCGDETVIRRLLSKLRFLGKKSSLGWGEIERIELAQTYEDFSIQRSGKLMRNVPVDNSFNLKSDKISLFRLTHPYWKKSDLKECIVP